MIGGASDPPALVSQESPPDSKKSPVPSQDVMRGLSRAWAAAEGQLVGDRMRFFAVVAAVVVVAGLGAMAGSVELSTCWKKQLVSFSIFGHARPSLGRAGFCTNPFHFRPPSLREKI